MTAPRYVLDRTPPPPVKGRTLDASQQAVVDHPGGPLLVLAGPGTGKTTTLVEAVVDRVHRGLDPSEILVLTFSRKAAEELRERITARLARAVADPAAWTFHAWCLAQVSAYAGAAGTPRLLSGPERLVRLRDLLVGGAEGVGTTRWPPTLQDALRTRGMAREVADLLDRARERGLDPADLRRLGTDAHRADWSAAADFFDEYIAVLGAAGEMDYAELVRQALQLLDDPQILEKARKRYRAVFVDEYQDTDPAQEQLLTRLVAPGGDLVVVGDPDQSIYAFRGADVRCLLRFPDVFRNKDGTPARSLSLGVCRRSGPNLVETSRRIAGRLPTIVLPGDLSGDHRVLDTVVDVDRDRGADTAEIRLYDTVADEAAAIADMLRRAHLTEGMPWREMAVLVRSGVRTIPEMRRALVAAGVPVAVAADEVPVARDPAVAPLLLALRCASESSALDEDAVDLLLTSPLIRATPADLRRLGRLLRSRERERLAAEAEAEGADAAGHVRLPRPSATLLREAVASPGDMLLFDERQAWIARPAQQLADLLDATRAVIARGGGAEEALWELWQRSRWPNRLAAASAAGGQRGRAADRDLDAVVALFDAVARMEERRPRAGVTVLVAELEAQEIPAESRREGPLAQDAVRLLTAHRSKGLEWDFVVVAAVQDGVWPDLRRRTSLLEGDRLSRDGVLPPPTPAALLVEERRLFYVAITRARRRLVVTAVRSPHDDGERPSRFLEDLGLGLPEYNERPVALLSLSSLVGRLRRATVDPDIPEPRRVAAASELARLAAPSPAGGPHVPAAHPDTWWGLLDVTPGAGPVRPTEEPVRLSGSAVSAYDQCPLRWFLEREARAASPSTTAQGFGLAVHALARLVATGALRADLSILTGRLDEVWGAFGFDAAWQSDREHRAAIDALDRFLRWHSGRPERTYVASEAPFEFPYADTVLRGSIDRVERDEQGRAVVVDFKTGKTKPTKEQLKVHAQLGVYQIAVREGQVQGVGRAEMGGAELVHLRQSTAGGDPPVQLQAALTPDGDGELTWADELVHEVAIGIRQEMFPARINDHCERCPFARACPAQDEGGQVVR